MKGIAKQKSDRRRRIKTAFIELAYSVLIGIGGLQPIGIVARSLIQLGGTCFDHEQLSYSQRTRSNRSYLLRHLQVQRSPLSLVLGIIIETRY